MANGQTNTANVTCQFLKNDGSFCKRSVAQSEAKCWQHARTWKRRWGSLTKNQTLGFVLTLLALIIGVPSLWFAYDSWRSTHPGHVANIDHVELTPTEQKDLTIHRQTFKVPKEGWMPSWGGTAPNLVWGVANGIDLGAAKKKFVFVLACRVDDSTVDEPHDTTVEHSVAFDIEPGATQIAIPVSQAFIARVNPPKLIWVYLLMMPSHAPPGEIRSLSDVDKLGGVILARSGFQSVRVARPPATITSTP